MVIHWVHSVNLTVIDYTFPDVLGTVDFIDPTDGCVIFRTNDKERNRVVLQLGTASPERALMVAKKVVKHSN